MEEAEFGDAHHDLLHLGNDNDDVGLRQRKGVETPGKSGLTEPNLFSLTLGVRRYERE
jgi:hypothetical protein